MKHEFSFVMKTYTALFSYVTIFVWWKGICLQVTTWQLDYSVENMKDAVTIN